jgi:lactoylglutathione lyase
MITGIGHLAFTVGNMEESIHFYCDILGFKKAFELNNDKGEPWIVYIKVTEGQFIELFYGGQARPETPSGMIGYSHLCLTVDDIDMVADSLKEKGIILDAEPKQGTDLNYQCWAKDPDGNRIEFMQMSPDSLQAKS